MEATTVVYYMHIKASREVETSIRIGKTYPAGIRIISVELSTCQGRSTKTEYSYDCFSNQESNNRADSYQRKTLPPIVLSAT